MRHAVRASAPSLVGVLTTVAIVAGCDSMVPAAQESLRASATATSSTTRVPRPCSLLTQATAARVSGDAAVTNQGTDVIETPSAPYVACIFADPKDEANSVVLQIKRVSGGVDSATLRGAAEFFARGEPVQPFQSFAVLGVGDQALGKTTPGVVFIVFALRDLLIYVGAGSASVSARSLRAGVENLARLVATTLSATTIGWVRREPDSERRVR